MPESIGTLLGVLLDSSWRMALVAAGTALTIAVFRIRANSWRHATWAAVLCAMFVMPVLLYWTPPIPMPLPVAGRISPIQAVTSQIPDVRSLPIIVPPVIENDTERYSAPAPAARHLTISWRTVIGVAYVLGVLYGFLRLIVGLWVAERLRRDARHVDLPGFPSIYDSESVVTPVTLGLWRPRIVLPDSWRFWPAAKLHAILAHENTHIRRGDPWINLISNLNTTVYWFHPLAWWLRRQLAVTSEYACDDAAVRSIGVPADYAAILVEAAGAAHRNRGRRSALSVF
jgi:beta-lactamase regulating signal transducer with metallopeptidase domain